MQEREEAKAMSEHDMLPSNLSPSCCRRWAGYAALKAMISTRRA
ncbi:hypothetical protein ACLB1R_21705 [Escherichia coli]